MGSFYTSHTLLGPTQKAVLTYLGSRPALVSKTENGFTTVLDEACESQDTDELSVLGRDLSAHFRCPVLAVLNHDSSVLFVELYEDGKKSDEYNSLPSEVDESLGNSPIGGNAVRLAAALGASDIDKIELALRSEDYSSADERHVDFATALGIPAYGVAVGFHYVSEDAANPAIPEGTYVGTTD